VRALIALFALTLGGCAALSPEARDEEVAYQVAAAVDLTQTLRIADTPERFHELNPVLGPHPQPTKVATYFAATAAVHYGITATLSANDAPAWLVRSWEIAGLSLEAVCITNNAHLGITPTLSFHVTLDQPAHTTNLGRVRK
jgi:hypothetical protein